MRKVNHETITVTLSLFKILSLNGFNPIRVKQRLHMRRKRDCESSWSRRKNPKVFLSDKSLEFGKHCEDLSWNHRTSTPYRFETNGIAERAVRRVEEGTSAVFLQSGLGGLILWKRRFGEPFKGPRIPFGAMVEYYPISTRDQSRLHQLN